MGDDEFSKKIGEAAGDAGKATIVAVATIVGGPAAGIVAAAVTGPALTWFRARAAGDDDAFRDARIELLEEHVKKLDAHLIQLANDRAAEGQAPETLDAIAQDEIYSDFALAISTAATETKRDALVCAAVRQHDPTAGSLAARRFWWSVVRDLRDIQIDAIRVVGTLYAAPAADHSHVIRSADAKAVTAAIGGPVPEPDLDAVERLYLGSAEEVTAFGVAMLSLCDDARPALASKRYIMPDVYFLNGAGRAVLNYITHGVGAP